SEIMIALASQLSTYLNAAEQTAERRYKELREDIIKEFARSDSSARAEAFSDPDYQFVLRDAHETYARSGQAELRDELVRLLIERSKQPSGSRSAL
ncbi:LPO_1073/Vpar_1526 family protein, partial [Acinetobacter baumannii]